MDAKLGFDKYVSNYRYKLFYVWDKFIKSESFLAVK